MKPRFASISTVASLVVLPAWGLVATQDVPSKTRRWAVTHVQDRSVDDAFAWLEGAAAESLRQTLSAAGVEVIHTEAGRAQVTEESIGETGLPPDDRDARADGAKVMKADTLLFGEYVVEGGILQIVLSAGDVKTGRPLGRTEQRGEVPRALSLLREAVIDLLGQLGSGVEPANLERVRALPMPQFDTLRWHFEGRLYYAAGQYPEAWYAFERALQQSPGHFLSRLFRVRSLRAQRLADLAVEELEALLSGASASVEQALPVRGAPDVRLTDSQQRLLVLRRAQSLALAEAWAVLDDACASDPGVEPPLYCPVIPRIAGLYVPFEEHVFDAPYRGTVDLAAEEEARLARLHPAQAELELNLRLARYWHWAGDASRAGQAIDSANAAWMKLREALDLPGIAVDELSAIEAELAHERERLLAPFPRLKLAWRPVVPRRTSVPASTLEAFGRSRSWTAKPPTAWPAGFAPLQVLTDESGGKRALGVVNWRGEQGSSVTQKDGKSRQQTLSARWYAWSDSRDGLTWSAPQLAGPPLNRPPLTPGESRQNAGQVQHPVVIARRDGTWALFWLQQPRSNAYLLHDGEEDLIFDTGLDPMRESCRILCAQSRDREHWSAPTVVPVVDAFAAAEMPDGSILVAGHNTQFSRSFDLQEWTPPRLAADLLPMRRAGDFDSWDMVNRVSDDDETTQIHVDEGGIVRVVCMAYPDSAYEGVPRELVIAESKNLEDWSVLHRERLDPEFGPEQRVPRLCPLDGGSLLLAVPHVEREPLGDGSFRAYDRYDLLRLSPDGATRRLWQLPVHANVVGLTRGNIEGRRVVELELNYANQTWNTSLPADVGGWDTLADMEGLEADRADDEPQQTRLKGVALRLQPRTSETNDVANSVALLVAADLNLLETVRVVVSPGDAERPFAGEAKAESAQQDFRVRWADELLQIRATSSGASFTFPWRITAVDSGAILDEGELQCHEDTLHETQKELSRRLAGRYGMRFPSSNAADLFEIPQVWKPYSFRILSKFAPVIDSLDYDTEDLKQWRAEDPDMTLDYYLHPYHIGGDFSEHVRLLRTTLEFGLRVGPSDNPLPAWKGPIYGFGRMPPEADTTDRFWFAEGQAIRDLPQCTPVRLALLSSAVQERDVQKVREHLQRVEAEVGDGAIPSGICTLAYEVLGDYSTAADRWEQWARTWGELDETFGFSGEPVYATPVERRARCRILAGRYDAGLADLADMLDRLPPGDAFRQTRIAMLWAYRLEGLRRAGRLDEALETARPLFQPEGRPSRLRYPLAATVAGIYLDRHDDRKGREFLTWVLSMLDEAEERDWYDQWAAGFLAPSVEDMRVRLTRVQKQRPLIGS